MRVTKAKQSMETVRGARERVDTHDLLVLFSIPLVLMAGYAFPSPLRQSYAFEYADPTLVDAMVSPYLHLNAAHLLTNVIGYLVVVPVAYAVSAAAERRQRFFVVFATFVTVLPPVLSYLNLAAPRASASLGFSGVVLAFVGYLAFATADHADANLGIGPRSSVAPVVFFLGVAVISPLSVQSVTVDRTTVALGTTGLVAVAVLAALLFALSAASQRPGLRRCVVARKQVGAFELAVFSLVVVFALLVISFPIDPVGSGISLNLYGHLLGYALGFMVPYTTTELSDWAGLDAT